MKKVANVVLNDFTNDSRVWKISNTLKKFGYSPTVVAIHNQGLNYEESIFGVDVNRIKLKSRSWVKWKAVQFLKYLEFMFRVVVRFRKVDIVHCNDLGALPIGLLIKLVGTNVCVVYDCHEYEVEVNGLKGLEKKAKEWLERSLIKYADKVSTVSDSIANEYARLYKISKPHLILNCPAYVEQQKHNLFRQNLGIRSDQTIFLYQGGLSQGRGIELLLEVFSNLKSDKNVLICMGYGSLEQLIQQKANKSDTIYFHQAVNPQVLLDYTSSADYGILFYENTCLNHWYCSPNKIFEYIMAGLPVLTSNLFEIKRLVESEGIGIVARTNTVEGFRQAVMDSLAQDYSVIQENVFAARNKHCWEEQEKVLKEIYDAF